MNSNVGGNYQFDIDNRVVFGTLQQNGEGNLDGFRGSSQTLTSLKRFPLMCIYYCKDTNSVEFRYPVVKHELTAFEIIFDNDSSFHLVEFCLSNYKTRARVALSKFSYCGKIMENLNITKQEFDIIKHQLNLELSIMLNKSIGNDMTYEVIIENDSPPDTLIHNGMGAFIATQEFIDDLKRFPILAFRFNQESLLWELRKTSSHYTGPSRVVEFVDDGKSIRLPTYVESEYKKIVDKALMDYSDHNDRNKALDINVLEWGIIKRQT